MNKSWDTILQILFVIGLLMVAGLFYFTRLSPLQAGDQSNDVIDPYQQFTSAFQFEQEEERLNTQIKVLKSDYASNLEVYLQEKMKISSGELSELEKREKLTVLSNLYNQNFFQHKLDLIDEQQRKLADLLDKKCLKFCTYQDLPGGL